MGGIATAALLALVAWLLVEALLVMAGRQLAYQRFSEWLDSGDGSSDWQPGRYERDHHLWGDELI